MVSGQLTASMPNQLLVAVGDDVGGARDEDQAQHGRRRGQPEPQSPPPQVGLGDDPGDAHEDRHRVKARRSSAE